MIVIVYCTTQITPMELSSVRLSQTEYHINTFDAILCNALFALFLERCKNS